MQERCIFLGSFEFAQRCSELRSRGSREVCVPPQERTFLCIVSWCRTVPSTGTRTLFFHILKHAQTDGSGQRHSVKMACANFSVSLSKVPALSNNALTIDLKSKAKFSGRGLHVQMTESRMVSKR